MSELLSEIRGSALWLTINREARRNALNDDLLFEMARQVRAAEGNPDLRAVVITGAGDKAFCAGADLNLGASAFAESLDSLTTSMGEMIRTARRSRLPLIARVNGACVAGGTALLGLCDVSVAVDGSTFALPEVAVGVFPFQVYVLMREILTPAQFADLAFTGRRFDTAEALALGLVNRSVARESLDEAVESYVSAFSRVSPAALNRGKRSMSLLRHMPFEEAMSYAEAQVMLATQSVDATEGISAFTAKREPDFRVRLPRNRL